MCGVQIEEEISSALEFLKYVYGIFGFTFQLKLSTRPDKYLGKVETWELAENVKIQIIDNILHDS